MKIVPLLIATLFLATFPVVGGFAADSEDFIGSHSSAPEYEVDKKGQLHPVEDESAQVHEDGQAAHADEHAGDEHHEVQGGLPQLNFSTYPTQIFWLFIAFIVLYFIFSKKTLPEISSTLEDRREHVEGDIDSAARLKEEAEDVHAAYDEILSEARKRASDEFANIEESIKASTNKKLSAFKSKAAKKTEATEQGLNEAKKKAIEDMHSVAAEVASAAAEKIVGISTDIDQAKTLVKNIDRKAA
ncbi:MAG: hypothetical protein H6861_09890 [Rhodospirillales bacterium]|nr:hypothetical protein [Rhodospirillales bacterium]